MSIRISSVMSDGAGMEGVFKDPQRGIDLLQPLTLVDIC